MFNFFRKKPFVNPYLSHKPVIIYNNLFHELTTKIYMYSVKHSKVKEFDLVEPRDIVDTMAAPTLNFYSDSIIIPYNKFNDVIIKGANNKHQHNNEFDMDHIRRAFSMVDGEHNDTVMRRYSRMYYYATILMFAPYNLTFDIDIDERHYRNHISTVINNNKTFGLGFIIRKQKASDFICGMNEDEITVRTKLYYYVEEYLIRTLKAIDSINITYHQNRLLTNSLNITKKPEKQFIIPSRNFKSNIDVDDYYNEIKSIIYK